MPPRFDMDDNLAGLKYGSYERNSILGVTGSVLLAGKKVEKKGTRTVGSSHLQKKVTIDPEFVYRVWCLTRNCSFRIILPH